TSAIFSGQKRAEIVGGESLPGERRRFGWKRLRRPGLFAWHVASRNGALFDRPNRFAGLPIEDPHESLFADLGYHVDVAALVANGQQLGRGGGVVVPDIMVDHLKMPQAFAGAGIESQQAVGEQVRAFAIRAVEIVLGARGGRVEDTARLVDR